MSVCVCVCVCVCVGVGVGVLLGRTWTGFKVLFAAFCTCMLRCCGTVHMLRVGQNRIHTPYMTSYIW